MKPFLKLTLFVSLLAVSAPACHKDSKSPNNLQFSLDGGQTITCWQPIRPGVDYFGGANCELSFDRYGTPAAQGATEVGVFAGYDCTLMTAPLPYKSSNFTYVIDLYQGNSGVVTYAYPGQDSTKPGNLVLTLLERDNHRVRGTVTGTIYQQTGSFPPSQLTCSFDLDLPELQ